MMPYILGYFDGVWRVCHFFASTILRALAHIVFSHLLIEKNVGVPPPFLFFQRNLASVVAAIALISHFLLVHFELAHIVVIELEPTVALTARMDRIGIFSVANLGVLVLLVLNKRVIMAAIRLTTVHHNADQLVQSGAVLFIFVLLEHLIGAGLFLRLLPLHSGNTLDCVRLHVYFSGKLKVLV
ncbi:hypothetical protein BpHYR1_008657 [Brachionus plicatilis]|uniref:Uncharacterized protein n=1 Tax=Brachionus plicatilis TaxID=10195 RepID=A0A3M7TAT0_BRAPC|nr:hypothetical protein BpHYR1_008657 [Brachionus plicatilis]